MYNASSDFREKAVDGTTPQNVILAFDNLYFSGNDGDFADSGVTFEQFFNTAEDLSFGEAPSDTLDFTVMNDTSALASFEYGDAQAYFGVRTDTEEYTMPEGVNAHIEYEGVVFEGKDDGLYAAGGGYGSTSTTESAESVTFDSPYEASLQSVLVTLTPQQSGSGTPSPDNVRPITGTESVTVARVGKNFLPTPSTWETGKSLNNATGAERDLANAALTGFIPLRITAANSYYMSGLGYADTDRYYRTYVAAYNANKEFLGRSGGVFYAEYPLTVSSFSAGTPQGTGDIAYIRVTIYPVTGYTASLADIIAIIDNTAQIERGSAATEYEPYNGETITTDLGRTVYGGTLDVVNGELVVDRAMVTYDGSENWYTGAIGGGTRYRVALDGLPTGIKYVTNIDEIPNCVANLLPVVSANTTWRGNDGIAMQTTYGWRIYCHMFNTSDVTPWKAFLSEHPLTICYELATPETYQLTPQQVSALLGENTVTSDAGNVQVEYLSGTGSTGLLDGKVLGLLGTDDKVYAVGEYASVVIEMPSLTASEYTPNRFMVEKMQSGRGAVFSGSAATVWRDGAKDSWEYIPMGMYQVERPANNLALTVKVNDAHDYMTKFDADASAFIESIQYPITIGGIYTALCDFVGVEYESATFTGSDVELAVSPFPDTSTTLRGVLKWIAERAFSVAHFDRVGVLKLYWLGSTVAEEIQPDNIAWDKATFADYDTQMVTSAIVKDSAGTTLTFGHGDNPYVIAGNPFVSTLSASELTTIQGLPEFTPLNVEVIYPSPCTDVGDFVSVQPKESTRQVLMDVYQRVFANEDNEAYAIEIVPYTVPLMSRTLTFTGWLYGRYVATGNRKRIYDLDNAAYNASISIAERIDRALTPTEVFNKLTDNGRIQGLYMADGQIYINAEYIKTGTLNAIDIIGSTIRGSTFSAGRTITLHVDDYSQSDVDLITEYILGERELTQEEFEHLDVNKDGVVNIIDSSYISRMLRDGEDYIIDARVRIDGDAPTTSIINIGDVTRIGYNSIQTNIVRGTGNVETDGQMTAKGGIIIGDSTDDAHAFIPGGSGQISFTAGGHTLTIDSYGVRVDGRVI